MPPPPTSWCMRCALKIQRMEESGFSPSRVSKWPSILMGDLRGPGSGLLYGDVVEVVACVHAWWRGGIDPEYAFHGYVRIRPPIVLGVVYIFATYLLRGSPKPGYAEVSDEWGSVGGDGVVKKPRRA